MDKKSARKKKKLQNRYFHEKDKENFLVSKMGKRSNSSPSLTVVGDAADNINAAGATAVPPEDWNVFVTQFYKKKKSTGILGFGKSIADITNENYWQNLSESDRRALVSALSENRDLHKRITQLEDENIRLKALLDEARSLVEVLTELLEEEGDESYDDRSDDSFWDDL